MSTRPLSSVCSEQHPDPVRQRRAIESLLVAGADVHETDKNGVTPLHHAVRFRSVAAVRELLARGASVNQTCKRSGSTPLHRAVTNTGAPGTRGAQAEAREIVRILLEHGADPAIRNKRGKRPVEYTRDEVLRRLLGPVRAKRRRTGSG